MVDMEAFTARLSKYIWKLISVKSRTQEYYEVFVTFPGPD